jgi:hypothetical protein
VEKKEYIGILCFLPPNVYHGANVRAFQIMHFLLVSSINAFKCHIINFLLTSLARYVQRNIGPQSFCTNLAFRLGPHNKDLSPIFLCTDLAFG